MKANRLSPYTLHPLVMPSSPSPPPQYSPSPSPPLTPPPLKLVGSPYWRSPLPPVSETDYYHPHHHHHHQYQPQPHHYPSPPISLHPLLRFSFTPNIAFDLLRHPSTITTLPDHRALSPATLAEPATNPPLPCLTIISPHLPWLITVSSHRKNNFISVSEVLLALHRALSLPVAPDYDKQPSDDALFHANNEYHRRIQAISDWRAREEERWRGMKRIDFLCGRTRFLGLSAMGREPGVWVLSAA